LDYLGHLSVAKMDRQQIHLRYALINPNLYSYN